MDCLPIARELANIDGFATVDFAYPTVYNRHILRCVRERHQHSVQTSNLRAFVEFLKNGGRYLRIEPRGHAFDRGD